MSAKELWWQEVWMIWEMKGWEEEEEEEEDLSLET